MTYRFLALVGLASLCMAGFLEGPGAKSEPSIRLNQVGFYPEAPKTAVVVGGDADSFFVINAREDTVERGPLRSPVTWELSGETVRRASFDSVQRPGTYRLLVPGIGSSYPFVVRDSVLRPVAQAALKGYYYQRASTALPERYAGRWARPPGHPDTAVQVHHSAATEARPQGTRLQGGQGWYDAGDYNKYVVNSGISTYTLLALHEHYPEVTAGLDANIPESGDAVPDVLDEALWNLRWMLRMQAPDGGVYHKLTHADFSGMVMPDEATAPRYVVQKGTAATLDFAAVMGQSARIFAQYDDAWPGMADTMRTAAVDAWQWARQHPDVPYNQWSLNEEHDPDITTGAYGDDTFDDEFAWAAAELAVTTGVDSFLTVASPLEEELEVPSWPDVAALGMYTLLHFRDQVADAVDTTALRQKYLAFARELAAARKEVPYRTVMGHEEEDFAWGSNSVAANQAMALLQAARLTDEPRYRRAALSNVDYLLGRNATGYSFLTGTGDRTPQHIHHRPSEADAVEAPVPGLLAGGPNPGRQDRENCADAGVSYPSDRPARAYVDHLCSYASNEIAINWNAPLVYVAAALEAIYAE